MIIRESEMDKHHSNQDLYASMIRVDHAGEHGAVRIYDGQRAVFAAGRGRGVALSMVEDMAAQEQAHLDGFDRLVVDHHVRPTIFQPLWHVAGFALGAVSALTSEAMAMTCTAAVEEEIDAHYARQLTTLAARANADGDITPTLEAFICQCRADERDHRAQALAAGGEATATQKLVARMIRAGCRIAIRLSERV